MDTPAPAVSALAFQATLTKGITREHLPQLVRLLDHLLNSPISPESFEDALVSFAIIYGKMLHYAGHLANGHTDGDYSLRIAIYEVKLTFFLKNKLKLHGHTDVPPPSFKDLWIELRNTFQEIDGAVDSGHIHVNGSTTVLGRRVERWQAYALEYLQHCGAVWTQTIASIFEKQPVYLDLPSNYDVYVGNRLAGGDPFFEMTAAFKYFSREDQCDNRSKDCCTGNLLMFFAGTAAYVADLFAVTSYTPTPAQVNILSDTCARRWAIDTGEGSMSLWSNYPRVVREYMAGVNARGVADVLVRRCHELIQEHPSRHVSWFLHVWLVERVVATFDGDMEKTTWIKNVLLLYDFLGDRDLIHNPLQPKDNYISGYFAHYRLSRSNLERANRLMNMEDVPFVPTGPPLDPLHYTDPIQVTNINEMCVLCQDEFGNDATVMLRACKHIMHLECLRTMINGVERNSNRCPLDRKRICPRRTRQPAP
jgi:hypothetical protein